MMPNNNKRNVLAAISKDQLLTNVYSAISAVYGKEVVFYLQQDNPQLQVIINSFCLQCEHYSPTFWCETPSSRQASSASAPTQRSVNAIIVNARKNEVVKCLIEWAEKSGYVPLNLNPNHSDYGLPLNVCLLKHIGEDYTAESINDSFKFHP